MRSREARLHHQTPGDQEAGAACLLSWGGGGASFHGVNTLTLRPAMMACSTELLADSKCFNPSSFFTREIIHNSTMHYWLLFKPRLISLKYQSSDTLDQIHQDSGKGKLAKVQ